MNKVKGIVLVSLFSLLTSGCISNPSTSSFSSSEEDIESSSVISSTSHIPSSKSEESSFDYSSTSLISSSEEDSDTSSYEESSSEIIPVCQHTHLSEVEVIKEPTIINNGINKYLCLDCHQEIEEATYKLDEYVFDDAYYMYDGQEHDLLIKGMIPYGTSVEYENNSLKEIGEKEATAKIYDSEHNLLDSKKATIHVIENTGFPNLYIDTNGVEIVDKENYVDMKVSTTNCEAKYAVNNLAGGVRFRGNGTMTYDKKAFRLKFTSKNNLFGLNNGLKAKSWVLLADYADQSMMRNATALYMGDSLLNYSNNYASDYKHVNVYLNNDYNGVYLLAEQQQANAKRVSINEAESNYTGTDIGYLLELDNYANQEDYYFSIGSTWGDTVNGINLPRKDYSIKTDCYDTAQVNYIKKYLGNVYKAFMQAVNGQGLKVLDENHDLVDSPYDNQFDTINSMIDLESVFKMYILHELIKTVDVGFSSFYMFVDFSETSKYPRLTFGAPWDFDWSSGNVNESPYTTSRGEYNSTNFGHLNPWFFMLSKTDFFKTMAKKYYKVFIDSGILTGAINQANYEAVAFKDEFAHNYQKWQTLGTIIYKYTPDSVKSFKVHKDAVDFLVNWLNERKSSIDTYLG